jgi:hypothetical protein
MLDAVAKLAPDAFDRALFNAASDVLVDSMHALGPAHMCKVRPRLLLRALRCACAASGAACAALRCACAASVAARVRCAVCALRCACAARVWAEG